jgi:hypothetical protein
MKARSKITLQREAADQIAEIMLTCLKKLPEDEQLRRVKAIENVKATSAK